LQRSLTDPSDDHRNRGPALQSGPGERPSEGVLVLIGPTGTPLDSAHKRPYDLGLPLSALSGLKAWKDAAGPIGSPYNGFWQTALERVERWGPLRTRVFDPRVPT